MIKPYDMYKNNTVEALEDLASYDRQKLTWFDNDQGLSSSFLDDVEWVFDFYILDMLYDGNAVVFNKNADNVLRELNEACDEIGYNRYGVEFLNSPELQAVREIAARALVLVKADDGTESTIDTFDGD